MEHAPQFYNKRNYEISMVTSRGHIYTCWLKINFSAGWSIMDIGSFFVTKGRWPEWLLKEPESGLLWLCVSKEHEFFCSRDIEDALVWPYILLQDTAIQVRNYLINGLKCHWELPCVRTLVIPHSKYRKTFPNGSVLPVGLNCAPWNIYSFLFFLILCTKLLSKTFNSTWPLREIT